MANIYQYGNFNLSDVNVNDGMILTLYDKAYTEGDGDNYDTLEKTIEGLETGNGDIKTLDISDVFSDKYNPLAYVQDEDDIRVLISALFESDDGNSFFLDAEKLFLSAVIFYVLDSDVPSTMDSVFRIVERADTKEDPVHEYLDGLFVGAGESSLGRKYYQNFAFVSGLSAKAVIRFVLGKVFPFADPHIAFLTGTDTLDLQDGGETVVYIMANHKNSEYTPLFRLLLAQVKSMSAVPKRKARSRA